MANLSQQKRKRMLDFLEKIKSTNSDEKTIISINEIENELTEKKYGLVWEKHEEHVDIQMKNNVPVFTEIKDKEVVGVYESDNYNFLLEGDNLHSLKLLEKTHKGTIDVIYIDPPYNTGKKDFMYDDAYVDGVDGFRHSKWLSFMSERLNIARKLLSENGILVISIGYQEINNLMVLCNELFENRQVVSITVQTSGGKPNGGFNVSHEHIIFITPLDFNPNVSELARNKYSSPYHGMTLASFNQVQRPNQAYPIFVDDNGHIVSCGKSLQEKVISGEYTGELADYIFDYDEAPPGTVAVFPVTSKGDACVWRLISSSLLSDWKKGYIKVIPQKSSKTKNKYTIQYLSAGIVTKIENGELETYKINDTSPTIDVKEYKTAGADIPTIWTDKQYYTTKGSTQLRNILDKKEFSYPKPLELITEILKRVSQPDSIILDFFAGSGTTGHAVIELNNEDNGNRKFILCTNNENNICENVTYERLKRVISGYKFTGKLEKVLYEKKLNLKDLSNIEEYLLNAEDISNQASNKHTKVSTVFKDGILRVVAKDDIANQVAGIPSNLKYYKTTFIPKVSTDDFYSVGEELTKHIKEMVQLEHGISLDSEQYILLLTDSDADDLERNPQKLGRCKGIYLSNAVFLTASQENLFKDISLTTIPNYYFEEELREVGEL